MEEISLKNVRPRIEERENQLRFYKEQREMIKLSVLPKSKELKGVMVSESRKNTDALVSYVDKLDDINDMIEFLEAEINQLVEFEKSELLRLGKYNEMQSKIYSLRYDMDYQKSHNGKKREWWKISQMVHLSERQCIRIFQEIAGKKKNKIGR